MSTSAGFLRQHPRLLAFGFTLAFFSGFGQTFLLSLYVPALAGEFALSNTQLSSLFAVATLASAFTLPFAGRYVDVWPLSRYVSGVLLGLSGSLLLLSVAFHPLLVLAGLWGLRLSGQALMSHTGVSTLARAYQESRGKAISMATLGHPTGEALLPLCITTLMIAIGWRGALQASAYTLLFLVLPLALWLIRHSPRAVTHPAGKAWSYRAAGPAIGPSIWRLLATRHFWAIAPAICLWGFLITGVLFFQLRLGASRGWSPQWVAASISAFAVANALAMLGSGALADRFSARRIYPFFLLPMLLGLALLGSIQQAWIYPIALFILALSNGSGSTMLNTVLPEVFGTSSLGAVRSLFAMALVISTAIGPLAFGALLDAGLGFGGLLWLGAGSTALAIGWSWQVRGMVEGLDG
ncbi:MAG: MFS transporter [Lewinellaceae bacterium]|nr:MFS transporter [Lewinellaceae bacterium]